MQVQHSRIRNSLVKKTKQLLEKNLVYKKKNDDIMLSMTYSLVFTIYI